MEGRATPPAPRSPTRSQVVEREVEEMAAKRREMDELESALKAKSESLDARVSRLRVSAEKQRSAGRARRTPVPSRSPASSRAPASPRSPASSRRGRPVATPSASPRPWTPGGAEPRPSPGAARPLPAAGAGDAAAAKWASLSSEIDDALGAAAARPPAAAAPPPRPAEPAAARQTALADEVRRAAARGRELAKKLKAADVEGERRATEGRQLAALCSSVEQRQRAMLDQADRLAAQERQLAARLAAVVAQQDRPDDGDDDDFSAGDRPFAAATLVEAAALLEPRRDALATRAAREPERPGAAPSRLERAWLGALRAEIAAVDAVGPSIAALWPPPSTAGAEPASAPPWARPAGGLAAPRWDARAPSADELFDETLCALASTRALRAGALGRGDGAAFGGACVVVDVCGVDALRDETTDRFQNTRGEGGLPEWGGGAAAPAAPPGASRVREAAAGAEELAALDEARSRALELLRRPEADGSAALDARWAAVDGVYAAAAAALAAAGGDVVRVTTSGALVAFFRDDRGVDGAVAAAALSALALCASEGPVAGACEAAGLPSVRCAVAAGQLRVSEVALGPDEIRLVPSGAALEAATRALAVGGGEIGDVVATVDAKARLLKRGWPKAAFEPEDFAARGKFTTLVRARKPPPPPRGPATTKERGPLRAALVAAPSPVARSGVRSRVPLLAREDAAAPGDPRRVHGTPAGASGCTIVCAKVVVAGGLTQATRDGAAKAVSRGVRGFGGRVVDVAASDDWITICAAFFAEPPLRASAGRGAAAALAVDYALTALETAARMTWGVGAASGLGLRKTCGRPDAGKAHFVTSTAIAAAMALANGAASKVNWAALDARHAHDGAAPRVLCDEATQRAARKQTVALPLPYFPRGADFSGDAPDDSAAAAAALKGPHLASPWGAKRAVGFSRDGHFMLLPAAEAPELVSGLDADTPRCVSCPAPLLRAVSDQRGGDDHHVLLDDPLGDLAPKAKQLAKRAFALAFGHCRAADDGAPPAGPGGRREPRAAAAPLGRSAFAKLLPALLGAGSYDDALADALWARSGGDAATATDLARAWARFPRDEGEDDGNGSLLLLGDAYEALRARCADVPRTARRDLLAAVDALPPPHQLLLRAAAVAAGCGDVGLLRAALAPTPPGAPGVGGFEAFGASCDRSGFPAGEETFDAVLDGLAELGFIAVDRARAAFSFPDALLHDAVLDSTPAKRKRALHAFLAKRLRSAQRRHADAPGGEERAAVALAHHAVGAGDAELACEAAAGLAALGGATFVAAFATVAVLGAPAPAQSLDVPLAPDEALAPRRATALLASLPAYRGALDALRAAQVATTLLKAADKFLAKLKLPATDDADPADFEAGGALA